MSLELEICVKIPNQDECPLAHRDQRRELLESLADQLIDHGATAVRWHDSGDEQRAVPDAPDAVLIDFLLKQRRAVEKKQLIAHLNQHQIGLNSARSLISELQERGRLREFQVPRDGRKSAVFVALIA